MHSSKYGDHHLVSGDDDIPLVYGDTPREWFEKIKDFKNTTIIPHHIAYTPNYRGISWEHFESEVCKVVEVCSKHGVSMSDTHAGNYYHNMGCRDEHNTVYEGIRLGKIFGFVGSTDHHAGFPGSYGDCLLGVVAENNTRSDIMNAIKNRHTYALTADKIKCNFEVDGNIFGSVVENDKNNHIIKYDVELSDFLDKLIIFKDLKPIYILNGETLDDVNEEGTYKVKIEFGWGNSQEPFHWDYKANISNGEILHIEKCYRGKSILAPSPDLVADDSVNAIELSLNQDSKTSLHGKMETMKNITPTSPSTSAIILTIKGDLSTVLCVESNGKTIEKSIKELISHSFSQPTKDTNSQTFKIHKAVPETQFHLAHTINHSGSGVYHLEIKTKNGSQAFVSPVFMK